MSLLELFVHIDDFAKSSSRNGGEVYWLMAVKNVSEKAN